MTQKKEEVIGILGAMVEEIKLVQQHTKNHKVHKFNDYVSFTEATMGDKKVVFALTNVGMVFASSVATTLINQFHCTKLIFTGVCGGLIDDINIGDIILAEWVINYDMNCTHFISPLNPNHRHKLGELPFIGLREFKSDPELLKLAEKAPLPNNSIRKLRGGIVSGSEFLSLERKKQLAPVWKECGGPLGVEMEGAAVAQIAYAYKVPFLLLRSVCI